MSDQLTAAVTATGTNTEARTHTWTPHARADWADYRPGRVHSNFEEAKLHLILTRNAPSERLTFQEIW